jgi:hypothetical protein
LALPVVLSAGADRYFALGIRRDTAVEAPNNAG